MLLCVVGQSKLNARLPERVQATTAFGTPPLYRFWVVAARRVWYDCHVTLVIEHGATMDHQLCHIVEKREAERTIHSTPWGCDKRGVQFLAHYWEGIHQQVGWREELTGERIRTKSKKKVLSCLVSFQRKEAGRCKWSTLRASAGSIEVSLIPSDGHHISDCPWWHLNKNTKSPMTSHFSFLRFKSSTLFIIQFILFLVIFPSVIIVCIVFFSPFFQFVAWPCVEAGRFRDRLVLQVRPLRRARRRSERRVGVRGADPGEVGKHWVGEDVWEKYLNHPLDVPFLKAGVGKHGFPVPCGQSGWASSFDLWFQPRRKAFYV